MKGLYVNFGSGNKNLTGYLSVDKDEGLIPDLVADLNIVPFKNFKPTSVEVAVWDNVLEHLSLSLPDFVSEMHRIIQPNGKLVIVSPNCFYWKNRIAFLFGVFRAENGWHINHSFLLKPNELKRYLELNGFEVTFNKPKVFYSQFSFIDEDLFLSEINLTARKRA